tara:strand:- start:334 stop:558 length:225 start_codon:yes stop_codon:yes gene_type:complete
MEALVVFGAIAIGFNIVNTMSNPENNRRQRPPKRMRKSMKKYIVYPNIINNDIDILNELDAMEKGYEIRSAIRV